MKYRLLASFIITVLAGCKEDREEERRMKMKMALSNDWQVHSIKVTDPVKFRRSSTLENCDLWKNWSFKNTGYFSFKQEADCNPYNYLHAGSWKMNNEKFLKISWKEIKNGHAGGQKDFIIEEVSADSLKLIEEITIWDEDLRSTILGTKKWTFTRK